MTKDEWSEDVVDGRKNREGSRKEIISGWMDGCLQAFCVGYKKRGSQSQGVNFVPQN